MKFAVLLISLAMASWAGPCVQGTLADYVNLGASGCTIGPNAVLYQNFTVSSGQFGATPIDPAAVTITPFGAGLNSGFEVSVNVAATAMEMFEAFFNFQVMGSQLTIASLELGQSSATGDGAVSAIADICVDRLFAGIGSCAGTQKTLVTLVTESFSQLLDAQDPPGSFFDIFVDLDIDGGLGGGTAQGGVAKLTITQTPEPGSVALFTLGGLLLAALHQRTRRKGGVQ